jgi:hypothetical protein
MICYGFSTVQVTQLFVIMLTTEGVIKHKAKYKGLIWPYAVEEAEIGTRICM